MVKVSIEVRAQTARFRVGVHAPPLPDSIRDAHI
jgi:hypothetical protein